MTNPPWDKRLSEGSVPGEAWEKLAEFALRIWKKPSVPGPVALLPKRFPLWILSGNENLLWHTDNVLKAKPAYLHNVKAHSGLLQLVKYFIKETGSN